MKKEICFVVAIHNLLRSIALGLGGLGSVGEPDGVDLEVISGERAIKPEIGCEVTIGLGQGEEGGLDEVTEGLGVTNRGCVDILDTGELQELLGHAGGDNAGTTRSGDETDSDGSALSGELHGNGVDIADAATPVTTTDGDEAQLGEDDGTADGGSNFLRALDAETAVTLGITDDDVGLEAGALTGAGLLLDGADLQNFVLQVVLGHEVVNDLVLLDGEAHEVDLLELDVTVLDETAQLGNRGPLLLLGISRAGALAATTTTASITTTASSTTTGITTGTAAATTTTSAEAAFSSLTLIGHS